MVDEAEPGLHRERIEHIVVLMLENRSFDHMLGYLKHPSPDYPGLDRIRPTCPVDPGEPDGDRVPTTSTANPVLGNDPDHSHEAVLEQMYGRKGWPPPGSAPAMSGFVASYRDHIRGRTGRPLRWWEKIGGALQRWWTRIWNLVTRRPGPVTAQPDDIMKCFADDEIPVLGTLAREFAVLVDWHAAVPGETWPNRQFAHAATSNGTANIEYRFYDDTTVFERLTEGGVSWGIYQDGVAQVWVYPRLWLAGTENFHDMDRFYRDVAAGTLPAYSFIEPNHGYGEGDGNSQHPGNNTIEGASFHAGEKLMADVYDALKGNPELFAKTLLLITYDEHGGFFDHSPPNPVPRPDKLVERDTHFDFSVTGVRVPAVAVSPLIPPATIDRTPYDHAAIPAMVREQFVPGLPPLNGRDAGAKNPLEHLRLLPAARTDLPEVHPAPVAARAAVRAAAAAAKGAAAPKPLNDFQASLVALAGAVQQVRRQPAALRADAVRPGGPAAAPIPEFRPDPATEQAAQERLLVPGSTADQVVDDAVADFERDDG